MTPHAIPPKMTAPPINRLAQRLRFASMVHRSDGGPIIVVYVPYQPHAAAGPRRWFKSNGGCLAGHHGGAQGRDHGGASHPQGGGDPRRKGPLEDGPFFGGPRPLPVL